MALSPTAYWRGTVDEKLADHDEKLDDHGVRLGTVERFMWKMIGAAIVGSMAGGGLVSLVVYIVAARINHS